MTVLRAGQNVPLTRPVVKAAVDAALPVRLFGVIAESRHGTPRARMIGGAEESASVEISANGTSSARVDISAVPAEVTTVALVATLSAGDGASFDSAAVQIVLRDGEGEQFAEFTPSGLTSEQAVILVELYRRREEWKVRAVGQGYDTGLAGICAHYGVAVSDATTDLGPESAAKDLPGDDEKLHVLPPVEGEKANLALDLVNKVLAAGVDGIGPYESAEQIAENTLAAHGDRDVAIERLLGTHRRWVGASGFATGLGGLMTLPVAVPTDVTMFYMQAARMSAAVAHLRGYDINSEEVRTGILVSLIGAGLGAGLGKIGVEVGTKTAMAALHRLPGRILIEINKKVGFRLLTKFGTKGAINLVRAVPLVGGGVGATFNVVTINQIHAYSKNLFVPIGVAAADAELKAAQSTPTITE